MTQAEGSGTPPGCVRGETAGPPCTVGMIGGRTITGTSGVTGGTPGRSGEMGVTGMMVTTGTSGRSGASGTLDSTGNTGPPPPGPPGEPTSGKNTPGPPMPGTPVAGPTSPPANLDGMGAVSSGPSPPSLAVAGAPLAKGASGGGRSRTPDRTRWVGKVAVPSAPPGGGLLLRSAPDALSPGDRFLSSESGSVMAAAKAAWLPPGVPPTAATETQAIMATAASNPTLL